MKFLHVPYRGAAPALTDLLGGQVQVFAADVPAVISQIQAGAIVPIGAAANTRNAILPNLTGFAMSLGFVLGGAILIEDVFNYQGVGYWLLNAVNNLDYPLMQALFLLITVAVLLAILASDIATALLDPRTRDAG